MGRTLFEMLKARVSHAEHSIYNPLKLRLGAQLQIDRLDYRGRDYQLREIDEYQRTLENEPYTFVDYCLWNGDNSNVGRLVTEVKIQDIKLRLNPVGNAANSSILPYQILLLSLYYECSYQEGIDSGLRETVDGETGEFDIEWNNEQRKYFRVNDLKTPYQATVKTLIDQDGNGVVDDDEIVTTELDYWDYHTELYDEAQNKYLEYLFVEYNTKNGWWQIWRGVELNLEQVMVL